MHVILDIVLPLFGLILCGFALGRPPLFGRDATRALTTFVFHIALPALLFRSMAQAGLPSRQDLAILETYYAGLLLVGTATVLGARLLLRESLTAAAVLGIGATFSNTIQIGIPLVLAAFGPQGLTQLLLIVTVHAAVLISAYTILVEMDRAGGTGRPAAVLVSTLSSVARNPIVLSVLAGLGWAATGLDLPGPVDRFIAMLGAAGVPCALFSLGMGLVGIRVADVVGPSLLVIALKLLVLPVVVWTLGRFAFDLAPLPLAVATVCATLPCGANAFIFAQRYQTHVAGTASAILISTGLSMLTTGLVVFWFTG